MIKETFQHIKRKTKQIHLNTDLVVVGGGLAGVCSSITAARAGLKVVLVQDRPVLGGNASSEVRLWSLGATSHMGNNNRWSRESGVINEILLDNLKRNKEGNHLILDTILLEKVYEEENITLLLNTSVYEVSKKEKDVLERVTGFAVKTVPLITFLQGFFVMLLAMVLLLFKQGHLSEWEQKKRKNLMKVLPLM